MEFHISRTARDRYQFDQNLFSFNGNAILADFHAARLFAQKMNQKKDLSSFPEQAVKAGQINAMGLMDEIFHLVCMLYRQQREPSVLQNAYKWLENDLGNENLARLLHEFTFQFPPTDVYQGKLSIDQYLQGSHDDIPNRYSILEELMMLWITNKNPALSSFSELFDDQSLQMPNQYIKAMDSLQQFFTSLPPFGPDEKPLVELLRAPAIAVPYSITGQLEYIRTHWGSLIGSYLYRLLSSLDLIKEEEKIDFMAAGFGPGPVSIPVYDRSKVEPESEKFSPDKEWMPRLVLIAKNTYVWLDQLCKKYHQTITHLDQIPDSELDEMASRGMTGLWLIGLWERSKASANIKQMCGNPEAVASAYSLFDYRIADDLGGEDAFNNLRQRAWQRGIRLASDMVPNHMGIDSPWLVEHPDWFLSLDYSPFPSYTFDGPDLSNDGRAGIYLEDHYYSRSDASVVFKRVDHQNGDTRFIYHGNDGTSMPWNDTAQLNYLNPEVREQVIQTILQVARRFPIIRFDAAMTLAKRHYQRLWYPEPGSGGDIPTRAEHGMSKAEFDAAMPIEFWREVVDRVAAEVPDTLLLAEAFWLMESYFVRTLGMHRVYNSAFMHLLRNEENAKYRTLMKNTLEFDPEILKRYVNFMNNPDERTAVDQFGKGDKYFGICTLMATLPGLPMFGHGQVEGFTEKYGMEYRRAYYDEQPDPYLQDRHSHQIFPLLHHRDIFAGVDNFLLYDFFTPEGWVDENVYAYSNSNGYDHALVVYHNRFASTSGWVKNSVSFIDKNNSSTGGLTQKTLSQGLSLTPGDNKYLVYREQISGLQFLKPVNEIIENGLNLHLEAYQTLVYLDFNVVEDDASHTYQHLYQWLNGNGVPDLEEAVQQLVIQPITSAFRQIANTGYFKYLKT
ncbi:MAG: alpha-amylase family glycosyl hydrolase, partial [Anaerolineaceae bacterium]